MIKHIVIWKLKEEVEGKLKAENAVHMKKILEDLIGKIPEIVHLEVGLKTAQSPANNDDIILNSSFKTWADLDVYVNHPEHVKVGGFVKLVTEQRSAVDYFVEC
jgi:hypothetical protein